MSFDDNVGANVTIQGIGRNAKAGAVVLTDEHTAIYVAGIDRWDAVTEGKQVRVTGTIRKRSGDDVVDANGNYRAGIPGDRFVLEHAVWTIA